MYNIKMHSIRRKASLFLAFSVLFTLWFPLLALAQAGVSPGPCETSGKICPLTKATSITSFLQSILEGIVKLGLPVIALAIIYSGFLFVAARGNSEKLTRAKQALLYTLIGAALVLGSWGLAQVISETVSALK